MSNVNKNKLFTPFVTKSVIKIFRGLEDISLFIIVVSNSQCKKRGRCLKLIMKSYTTKITISGTWQ